MTKSTKPFQEIFTHFSFFADVHMRIRTIIIGTCASKKELANRHLRKKKNILKTKNLIVVTHRHPAFIDQSQVYFTIKESAGVWYFVSQSKNVFFYG